MEIQQILDQIYTLPEASRLLLQNYIHEVSFSKGHNVIRAEKTETSIYFIKKGIARAYANRDSTEVTFWFGKEGDTLLSMKSYVANEKGYEDIELLEDCDLYQLKTEQLQTLFENDIHIANWGRKFAEKELLKTEERLISRQFRTATERYTELLQHNPDLLLRIQLGHIASYLGITQVSLSRIRAEIK
ncbi:Crp/Fnr family transcriptional regulator [Flavobacterium sp. FlaQc-48]|uniref:Crp/Fnr family transcriptional regulator n=1 Tax=Flavobacterium sp. FlaQc-48 TaxID=3374181 RepID=UPI003757C0BF